jgi:hypothetical protein
MKDLISFAFITTFFAHALPTYAADPGQENFFSPQPLNATAQKLPTFKQDISFGVKLRAYIDAGTPNFEQIKLIPSLSGPQRKELQTIADKAKIDMQALNAEFNEVRKKVPAPLVPKMLSEEAPQLDMKTKAQDFDQLLKARDLLSKLRSNRITTWETIQAKLSPTQLDQLDKIKSGEVPPAYMNSDP